MQIHHGITTTSGKYSQIESQILLCDTRSGNQGAQNGNFHLNFKLKCTALEFIFM